MKWWGHASLSDTRTFDTIDVGAHDWRALSRHVRRAYDRTRGRFGTSTLRARLGFGVAPFSDRWFARGTPIHRYYVDRFLERHADDIRGHCLEFQEDTYATRFGGGRVTHLDILHKERDGHAPQATRYADLTVENDVPTAAFDCIICTYVLHVVGDLRVFIRELHRVLRAGGVLFIAVPNITVAYPEFPELWRFTPLGLTELLAREFRRDSIHACSYGNSLTCAGEIRGLATTDFTIAELDYQDPRFGLVTCARAVKHA